MIETFRIITDEDLSFFKSKLKRDYDKNPIRLREKIDKDDLHFLYLEHNLTKPEIAFIMHCPEHLVNKWCYKYRLLKTLEQKREIAKLKNLYTAKQMTEEKQRERVRKMKETLANMSDERKQELFEKKSLNSKKMWENMSEVQYRDVIHKMSESAKLQAANESIELKQQRIKKFKNTWYSAPLDIQEKRKEVCRKTALKTWANMSEEKLLKIKQKTLITKQNKSIKEKQEINNKIYETKKKNGTLYSSKPELKYEPILKKLFNDDVITQYKSKEYPFACDFYIKSLDLYIELNFHWTHGKHPFDATNSEDIKRLNVLKERSSYSDFYKAAIYTWTDLDVRKRYIAQENNLKYKVFYNEQEIDKWIEEQYNGTSLHI